MTSPTVSIHTGTARSVLPVTLAITALSAFGVRAHAEELDPITISVPVVTTVGREPKTEAPIQEVTVEAKIAADAETLRTDSGVQLLKDRVREAAFHACNRAERFTVGDQECMYHAIKAAMPQVDAAVKRARGG